MENGLSWMKILLGTKSSNFILNSESKITHCGEYINGEKVGLWDSYYCDFIELKLL